MRRSLASASVFFVALTGLAFAAIGPACSAGASKDPTGNPLDPDGGGGGGNDGDPAFDLGGLDPDANLEGGGIVGEPRTCEEAAAAKSYVGCAYWPTVTGNSLWSIFDYAVVVANAGTDEAEVTVSGGAGGGTTVKVPPNALQKIYLPWVKELKGPDFDTCTAAKAMTASVKANKGAYHLVSSKPVTVYQFNALEYQGKGGPPGKSWSTCPGNQICPSNLAPVGCFSFSNDASLLLPSTAMTGNYRVTGIGSFGTALGGIGSYFTVTGTQDGTTATVKIGSRGRVLAGGGVPATSAGGTINLTLNAGDVYEIIAEPMNGVDLSGSLVQADKPAQVLTGIPCITNPIGTPACDHMEESVFPAETLGKDYFVTVPTGPNGNVVGHTVRIYGNVDGTKLTYAPSKPPGAPNTINAGDVIDVGRVNTDFRVTGDNAFAVGSFMLGGQLLDPSAGPAKQKGDPSMSFSTAVEQYRKKYIFLAPDDYDVSYVDIVAPEGTTISLDGASPPAGNAIGATGFVIHRAKLGAGKSGAHELTASKPVAVQVMGYGVYTSYQYPGGLDLKSIAPPPVK